MLTISKTLSANKAVSYHAKEFTAKEQTYWSLRAEIAGEWQGRLAEKFGLAGAVSLEDFTRLSKGQHPRSGQQLVRPLSSHEYTRANGKTAKTMEHRAGWDATFSAPKSVSLTALVGRDERVREAHHEAVKTALKQLEDYARANSDGNRPPESTAQLVVATFEHDTARPVDGYAAPQLHTHAVIFNMTERANGEHRALHERSLFQSQAYATAVYQSELTYQLRRLGYEIVAGRSGAPEIKGYTQEYLDASSPRSQQIREYLTYTGHDGKKAAHIAALLTRDHKEMRSLDEVMAANGRLAAEYGNQADAVVEAARERSQLAQNPNQLERVREAVTFSRDKNFERQAVVDARVIVRDALRRGMGEITHSQVRGNLNARLESGEFQIVERPHRVGQHFTTARTIEAEEEIVRRVREGQNHPAPIATRAEAIRIADHQARFNRAQKSVVEDVLSTGDRVQGIQGRAGSARTSVLNCLRSAAKTHGYQVEGLAPTSRAAYRLREVGIEAGTLQGFLARGAPSNMRPGQRHFYFVDESSLASTLQVREFLARLGSQDRVLLIGATRQHDRFEAGRPFEQLEQAGMRTAKLDEIVRQKDPSLKSAIEHLARGQTAAALDLLHQQGRIREIADPPERIRTMARTYAESPTNTLIVSPDNLSARELNLAVREELKANGVVAAENRCFRVLVERQDMNRADRARAHHYEPGDVVRYARGSKISGIEASSYGTVKAINARENLLTVEMEGGRFSTYDPRRLLGLSVYREVARDFSVGDKIQFTAPQKALGVANRDLAVIESIAPNGRIAARLESNRQIKFNPAENRHFDHGYSVTSHSALGLTAERVLIHADSAVHPDLMAQRFGYASVSRASHEAILFTNDAVKLGQHLGTGISKTSALEITQTSALAHDIGMHI